MLLLAALPAGAIAQASEKTLNAQLLDFARQGDAERVKLLVNKGANPNSRNRVGKTPLHMFAAAGNAPVVEFLVGKGAKLDVRDGRGLTPLGIAKSPRRQFITGGDNGEKIGDERMAALLEKLGGTE